VYDQIQDALGFGYEPFENFLGRQVRVGNRLGKVADITSSCCVLLKEQSDPALANSDLRDRGVNVFGKSSRRKAQETLPFPDDHFLLFERHLPLKLWS
jgi:hypothetical protein